MAYTFLDNSLTTRGVLTNKGGQKNNYWGDTITHEIATSQDVLTSVSLSVDKPTVDIDTTGNQKTWNHVIQGLSFNIDGIGAKVNENDYLIYQEGYNGRQYLMAITQVEESAVDSGIHYKTVQGLNAAAYDLSRKTLKPMTFAQNPNNNQTKGTPANILKYIFKDLSWDVRVIGNFGSVDYEITDGATSQSVLLDIISMFEAEVDGYIEKDNWQAGSNAFTNGGAIKRIFEFTSSLGHYKGQTIRYNKNLVSITKTGARDSMYTKLYVQGNGIDISDVNKGADFLVDDVANKKYNKLGAMSNPVTYLEGTIVNSSIDNPTALLAWGKKQLEILNHPRFNYSISATNDEEIQLGDTVIIQDTHASEPIFLKSKVISKNVSLADPFNNSFIVGEFSPIVIGADNGLEDTAQIMQLVNQANQTAVNAQNKANENAQKIEDTRTDLEKTIDQKLQEGKDYSNSLDQKQKEAYDKFEAEINKGLEDAQKERDEISKKADDMLTTANSHADDMYNNAVAVAKDEASKALSDANTALYEAKTDLTDGLNKEIADRNKAVSVVNSQAQDYATQAKSDAIEAAKTADGQVRKDFKETTDALSSSISQNKEDSDSKISTAQSTATQALDGLKTKVSQTDYDKKTGDLSTKVNTATQTANETKNELANVSKTVDSQSAKINTISNTVDGTTQTISDIKTEQGKQSGSIATLQSRADGFEATVTKVNNLSVGGRNYVLNSSGLNGSPTVRPTLIGTSSSANTTVTYPSDGILMTNSDTNTTAEWYYQVATAWSNFSDTPLTPGKQITFSADVMGTVPQVVLRCGFNGAPWKERYKSFDINNTNWTRISITATSNSTNTGLYFRIQGGINNQYLNGWSGGETLKFRYVKIEDGNTPTAWSPAPEDLSSATAKAQLTADKANLDLSKYKTDADGRISKAQSDITATANEVKTKVSQSDYDKKTGDLSTKVNTVTQTATETKNELAKVSKTVGSQSAKINTISNTVDGTKQTISDIKTEQGKQSGSIATLQSRADGFDATVKKVDNLSVGGRNFILNSDVSITKTDKTPKSVYKLLPYLSRSIAKLNGMNFTISVYVKIKNITGLEGDTKDNQFHRAMIEYMFPNEDGSRTVIGAYVSNLKVGESFDGRVSATYDGTKLKKFKDTNEVLQGIYIQGYQADYIEVSRPKLEAGNVATDWSPAPEDVESRVTALKLDIDGIHGTVNDPKKGLSATWDLANQGQTLAVQAKKDAKTADGKAVAAQKDATTAVTTAKGTQTTVTSVQKDVKDVQSKQTQTANQLTTEIKDRKNGDTNTLTQAKNFTSSSITSSEKGLRSEIQQSADGIVAQIQNNNLVPNSEFEPKNKGWRKFTNSIGATPGDIVTLNGTSRFIDWPLKGNSNGIAYTDTQWIVSEPSAVNGSVVSASIVAGRVSTIGNIAQALDMRIAYFDKDKKLIGSNSFGNIIDGSTYKGLQLYKLENMTPTSGTRYIGLVIAHSGPANDYIFRPMLNYGKTVSVYQPTYSTTSVSTVLALFKDNWSIGINDNSGKLISGINGDTSGTVIQGKKLVINPDTTFNGLNFMNGALIKDASISQAKIGNLQVNSAQITGLDVSKLTGDTANFVTANIKSLNANKLYGDTGYLGTTNTGRVINNQDHHLQLAAHGLYNDKTHRAQFELLSYDDPAIGDNMKGSLNYYSTTGDNVRGIRFKANQILAIDTYPDGAGSLYLSAYERGQVIISARDSRTNYKPIKASKFNVSSERRLKSDITDFDDGALEIVNKTKIHQYTKNETSEIGVIADEAPEELLSDDDKSISLYDYTSVLYKAVQELSQQVKELQDERTTLQ